MNLLQSNGMQPVGALAWEFWARGWRQQLLGLTAVVSASSLLYGAFHLTSDLSFRGTEVGTVMHFGLFWLAVIGLGGPVLSAWGAPQSRYTLPVSSFVAVAWPMACSMSSMFVLYATAATILNTLCEAGWPVGAPGLVAAVSVAWLQAIHWSTSNSLGLYAPRCLTGFAVLAVGFAIFASPAHLTSGWFHEGIDTSHVLVIGLATLVCVGLGTVGFATARRGNELDLSRLVDWVHRIFDWAGRLLPMRARTTPFKSPASALYWLEWTERGWYSMPGAIVVFGVLALLVTCFEWWELAVFFGSTAMASIPISAIVVVLGLHSESGQIGSFTRTRPLSDRQLANAILAGATVSSVSSALIWSAFLAAGWLIFERRADLSLLQSVIGPFTSLLLLDGATLATRLLGFAILGMGAVWGVACLIASLFLAGKKVGGVVVWSVLGAWILGNIAPRFLVSPEAQAAFAKVFVPLCIGLPLIGTAAVFAAGWWLRLISHNTLLLAAAILAAMLAGVHLSGLGSESGPGYPLLLWACCLLPVPLAAAPLAVWWHRHR